VALKRQHKEQMANPKKKGGTPDRLIGIAFYVIPVKVTGGKITTLDGTEVPLIPGGKKGDKPRIKLDSLLKNPIEFYLADVYTKTWKDTVNEKLHDKRRRIPKMIKMMEQYYKHLVAAEEKSREYTTGEKKGAKKQDTIAKGNQVIDEINAGEAVFRQLADMLTPGQIKENKMEVLDKLIAETLNK